jgi:hypothetical protein
LIGTIEDLFKVDVASRGEDAISSAFMRAITRLGSRRRRLIKFELKCVSGGVSHRAPLSLLNEAPFAGSGGRGDRCDRA